MPRTPPPPTQRDLLGQAVDAAPVLVFVADESMRYIAVNKYACEALDYSREEILRLRVTDVATGPSAAADYGRMAEAGWLPGVARLRCKDGSELVMRYRAGETELEGRTAYIAVGWLE